METGKLFYEDSHLKSFTAQVVAEQEGWIALDATVFYPEGGGQPCDLGQINGIAVTDVQEKEGIIWHKVTAPIAVGQTVQGEIDWQRRFELMQLHTAEHMISGFARQLYGCHNVGFHMGADAVTLDFDKVLTEEAVSEIERLVNEAVFENLPVRCYVPSEEELANIPYRSKKALPWPVRLVEIPGVDICACCGVHTKTTGELGFIKLLSCVKFHQGVRLEMVAGRRAYRLMRQIYDQNRQVGQAFSAKTLETAEAARRMNEALNAERFRSSGLERQLMEQIAREFTNQPLALYFTKELPARPLAEKISQQGAQIAAVFQGTDAEGYRFALISRQQDVAAMGKQLTQAFQGKGGGKDGFFQGSILATQAQIRGFW